MNILIWTEKTSLSYYNCKPYSILLVLKEQGSQKHHTHRQKHLQNRLSVAN